MPSLRVTTHLREQLTGNPLQLPGNTLAEVLNGAFAANPRLRGYILDDQGEVRRHVAIFIDGRPIHDRAHQSDTVTANSEVFIMQALSGGDS